MAKARFSLHHSRVIPKYRQIFIVNGVMVICLVLFTALVVTVFFSTSNAAATANINSENRGCNLPEQDHVITSPFLSVLTLNLAHGRKDAFNQLLQKSSTTRSNLKDIAEFLNNSGADLVALQEADSPSRWSGGFNHVDFVSEKTQYPCLIHASHAQKYMYDFGTALLSRVPYTNILKYTFEPSPPTTNKGFVMGEVRWNPGGQLPQAIPVSVISVHLDFSRKKVRESQIEEMRTVLQDIARPIIILGDFNTDWTKDKSVLKTIANNGNLKVHKPLSTELGTYKNGKHRLDWILVSNELEFVSYEVPQVVLSDHLPVFASVKLVDISTKEIDSKQYQSNPDYSHE